MSAVRPAGGGEGGGGRELGDLYDRTAGVFYPLALRITGDARAAEDAVEGLFTEIWKRREDHRGLEPGRASVFAPLIARCRGLALALKRGAADAGTGPAAGEAGSRTSEPPRAT